MNSCTRSSSDRDGTSQGFRPGVRARGVIEPRQGRYCLAGIAHRLPFIVKVARFMLQSAPP